jgi:hypothetical protein
MVKCKFVIITFEGFLKNFIHNLYQLLPGEPTYIHMLKFGQNKFVEEVFRPKWRFIKSAPGLARREAAHRAEVSAGQGRGGRLRRQVVGRIRVLNGVLFKQLAEILAEPGTGVIFFKSFYAKNIGERLAILTKCHLCQLCGNDHNIGYQEKCQYFCRKLAWLLI